jgi:hypothetical protein
VYVQLSLVGLELGVDRKMREVPGIKGSWAQELLGFLGWLLQAVASLSGQGDIGNVGQVALECRSDLFAV